MISQPEDLKYQSRNTNVSEQTQGNQRVLSPSILKRIWQWTGIADKTLWNYLELMIVPLLLLVVSTGISQYQKDVDEAKAKYQKEVDEARTKKEQERAENKAKQDILISYIDGVTDLMKNGQPEQGQNLLPIATSRTILTLKELDGDRNTIVLGFLKDSKLIRRSPKYTGTYEQLQVKYNSCLAQKKKDCQPPSPLPPLTLKEANLSKVDFQAADLNTLDLTKANLREANLTNAILIDVDLSEADLTGADLTGANLTGAKLEGAHLPGTLKNVRYCDTTMPDGNKKNDDCSFIPQPGSRYKVVTGNISATSSSGWSITAYRDPVKQDLATSVEIQNGTIVTLTGEYSVKGDETWVKIKDEGSVGGWVTTIYLVPTT